MRICRDQSTTYLQRFGYNVVRHPREGLSPLDVLGRQAGVMSRLGSLSLLVGNPGQLPAITRDMAAADINGRTTDKLKAGIALSLLGGVLSGLGAGGSVKASYEAASTMLFEFHGVLSDSVDPLAVGAFLREKVLNSDPLLDQYAQSNGALYIVTETIKSDQLTVQAERSDQQALSLDVPVLQQVLGSGIKVEKDKSSQGKVTYTGQRQLVFGFKCFELGVDTGKLALFSSAPGAATAMSLGTGSSRSGTLLAPDQLIELGV